MTELVAGPRIMEQSAFAGAGLLDDIDSTCAAIANGDWVAASLGAGATVVSAIGAVVDPIGTALSAGVGWVIEHLDPLKDWLQKLTGDDAAVAGFADTWANVARHLDELSQDLRSRLQNLDSMCGTFVDAVKAELATALDGLTMLQRTSGAVSVGFEIASSLVGMVYGLVRDAIADIVAKAIVWAAEIALTVGLGTPVVIAQAATTVAEWATNLFPKLDGLVESVASIQSRARNAQEAIDNVINIFGERSASSSSRGASEAITSWANDAAGDVMTTPRLMDHLFSKSPEEIVTILRGVDGASVRLGEGVLDAIPSSLEITHLRGLVAELWQDGNGESAQALLDAINQSEQS